MIFHMSVEKKPIKVTCLYFGKLEVNHADLSAKSGRFSLREN